MEIYTFQDLVKRVADINQKAIFNDYIPENLINELTKKNIEQIRVSNEDFFTGNEANVVSITYDWEDSTYFIMGRKKSFSSPLNPLWFGKKIGPNTDYMYCYPLDSRETILHRTTKERDLQIRIRYSEQRGSLVRVMEYDKKTLESKKLKVDEGIEEIAMDIFDNAKQSMNIFGKILKEYNDQQLKGDPR